MTTTDVERVVFSYSELDAWRQCPLKWSLAYAERWTGATKSSALQRGTDWHEIMATFYGLRAQGVSWNRAYKLAWKQHCIPADGTTQSERQLLMEWMLMGYVERWRGDEEWQVMAVEVLHEVPLSSRFSLKIRADLIVQLRGSRRLYLVDSKTGKDLLSEAMLDVHVQFPLYVWALRKAGIPIWGFICDNARTQRNKEQAKQPLESRFRRTLVYHSDAELRIIARDALADMRMAHAARARAQARSRDLPRHLNKDHCLWRCDYTSACQAGMRSPDPEVTRQFLRDTGYEQNWERH